MNDYEIGDEPLFDFLNHTQAVGRSVKLVIQTAAICDECKLDMHTKTVLHARDKHPSFSTKKDYHLQQLQRK